MINRKQDKSRWMIERERFRITDYRPPRPETDLSLRAGLVGIFRKLDNATGKEIEGIRQNWRDIAGETVARHSCPGILRGGFLEIYIDSSVWLEEVRRFHCAGILKNVQERVEKGSVKALRFRVNPKQCRNYST